MNADSTDTAAAHWLLSLDEYQFRETWFNMPSEKRAELPEDVRSDCYRRYKSLAPIPGPVLISPMKAKPTSAAHAAWQPLDLDELAGREPEAPRFIIPDWWPMGYATLLAGHGGVGKSGIALYLVVCMAAGVPFFGLEVQRRRVLYLSCEDRANVLHWRLSRICAHLGVELASLDGWLKVVDLVGRDCVLWERHPVTGFTVTPAYGELQRTMQECETQVLVVDGISDTYAGNENARTDVKRYVNALVALISADQGAVLLLGHLAKPAASNGQTTEGYSGSTSWHNSVRARWYLYPEITQNADGDSERSGDLILELQKSNLGRIDQSIRFTWDDEAHLFVGREVIGATSSDRAHRDRIEQDGILAAFNACSRASPPAAVPAATTGPRTAFNVLCARKEFPDSLRNGKPGRARFWRHVEKLRAMQLVRESSIARADRHKVVTLELTEQGLRACGQC